MPKDYKHRVQNAKISNHRIRAKQKANKFWRWLVVVLLLIAFLVFLNMILKMLPELIVSKPETEKHLAEDSKQKQESTSKSDQSTETEKKPETRVIEPEEPRYDFYTILPQAEVVVPDYEIKTRVREELVGKLKPVKYVMQAGSFREAAEAEQQKIKLAQIGIESRIEKAKVGNVIWHRVKIGPYDNPSSVSKIKELLQKNGFGVVVTENSP
jgi:cell division protein FtsN